MTGLLCPRVSHLNPGMPRPLFLSLRWWPSLRSPLPIPTSPTPPNICSSRFPSSATSKHFSNTTSSPSLGLLGGRLLRISDSMRTVACLIVLIALMASFAGGHASHGRIGIHSALDGRWPDLVGRDAEEAKTHILTERPNLNVQILSSDMMMTMDYNTNRVRIIVNNERKVVKCPTIG